MVLPWAMGLIFVRDLVDSGKGKGGLQVRMRGRVTFTQIRTLRTYPYFVH